MLVDAGSVLIKEEFCDRGIFSCCDQIINFKSFRDDVAAYAVYFAKNLKNSEIVLYLPENIYLFYVCFMALLHAKKDVVLPSFLTDGNVFDVLSDGDELISDITISKNGLSVINPEKCNIASGEALKLDMIGERCISFFTSGTTGKPKKIRKKFSTLNTEVRNIYSYQEDIVKKNAVIISSVTPYHLYGMLWRFLFPLCAGLIQDLESVMSVEELQEKQERYANIAFATTPSFMDKLAGYHTQYDFKDNCIAIYSSGSLLSAKTSKAMFETFGVSPFEIFGSTETGGIAYRRQVEGENWHIFSSVKASVDGNSCLVISSDFTVENPYCMRDIVKMARNDEFILCGRADRVVKIAENSVFLPEMEGHITDMPFIDNSYVLAFEKNSRVILGAVITLSDEGKTFLKANGKKKFVQNIKKHLSTWYESAVLPRKFRILDAIPVNDRGKTVAKEIAPLFDSVYVEPIIENAVKNRDCFSAKLTFLDDAPYFDGHFPAYPILPGVIQLYFAIDFLTRIFKRKVVKYSVNKLKFSNLILPMKTVDFSLIRKSENEYAFTYGTEKLKYSSGIIVIKDS